jgi:hypothetical protein
MFSKYVELSHQLSSIINDRLATKDLFDKLEGEDALTLIHEG